MPGRGLGAAVSAGYDLVEEDLLPRPDTDSGGAGALNDYFWGGGPPSLTQIPYAWLTPPLRFRPDATVNVATATQVDGVTARSVNKSSRDEYGESTAPSSPTLATLTSADPLNFTTHVTANYAAPRMRCPQLTLELLDRTDVECWLILAREVGDRIQITGAPATWPEGTTSLVIEGIQHTIGIDERQVVWNTAPIVGATPGIPGPWFRADSSRADGTDKIPF